MNDILKKLQSAWDNPNLQIEKVRAKALNWKITTNTAPGFCVFSMRPPKSQNNRKEYLFVFPRQGSFYDSYNPDNRFSPPDAIKDLNKTKGRIRELEKALNDDHFPSPKHRYGAEVQLQSLKNSLNPKPFHSRLLALHRKWILFNGKDLTLDMENQLFQKEKISALELIILNQGQNIRIKEFSEGMAHGTIYESGILKIESLPYAFFRKNSQNIFTSYPKIKTIIYHSIDSHSLGPSGIQIENRK